MFNRWIYFNPEIKCFIVGFILIFSASMMFCSTDCKDKFSSKAINMTDVLSADVKMLSDVVELFGSLKNFESVGKL